MRQSKHQERALEKAMELLAKMGVNVDDIEKTSAAMLDSSADARERQGEAALLFLAHPSKFITKKCEWCEEYFGTSYRSNSYCSNACRGKAFFKATGQQVNWAGKTSEERWGGEQPLVIDPETLKHLAEHYLKLKVQLGSQIPTATDQPHPVTPPITDVSGAVEVSRLEMTHTNNLPTNLHHEPVELTLRELLDLDFDAEFL